MSKQLLQKWKPEIWAKEFITVIYNVFWVKERNALLLKAGASIPLLGQTGTGACCFCLANLKMEKFFALIVHKMEKYRTEANRC